MIADVVARHDGRPASGALCFGLNKINVAVRF
jgi:hypothetical protein